MSKKNCFKVPHTKIEEEKERKKKEREEKLKIISTNKYARRLAVIKNRYSKCTQMSNTICLKSQNISSMFHCMCMQANMSARARACVHV